MEEETEEIVRLAGVLQAALFDWGSVPLWRAEKAVCAVLKAQAMPPADSPNVRHLDEVASATPLADQADRVLNRLIREGRRR